MKNSLPAGKINVLKQQVIPILSVILIYGCFILLTLLLEINEIVNVKSFNYNFWWGITGNFLNAFTSGYFIKKYISKISYLFTFKVSFNKYLLLLITVSSGIFLNFCSNYIDDFFNNYLPMFDLETYYEDISLNLQNPQYRILTIIGSGFITGLSEEFFLRGLCYNLFRKNKSITTSIILNIFIFILLHPIPAFIPSYILINTVICLFYEYSKSLMIPISIHVSYNVTSLILM